MLRQYSRGKRILASGLDKLREIRVRGRYMRYYIRPAQSAGNPVARNIDFYGLLLAASAVIFLISSSLAGSPLRGLFLTAPLMAPVAYTAFRIRKALENEAAVHGRVWKAGRICRERIKNISAVDRLNGLVVEILEKIPEYSGVHIVNERSGQEGDKSMSLAVRAMHRGVPVAVGCVIPDDADKPVTYEKIACLLKEIKKLDTKGVILAATGQFSGEARRAALELKKNLTLVDLYRLVDLARATGHEIFPPVSSEGGPEKEIGLFRYKKLKRFALERGKAKSYLYSAGLILAMYYTAGESGIFSAGYLFFAALNLFLSAYCIVGNREKDLLPAGKL